MNLKSRNAAPLGVGDNVTMTQAVENPSAFDSQSLRRFRGNVRRWYRQHGRDLPWRNGSDAYRVWISEIMLQQTTVAAVVPYYDRFLARFPTVESLAAAEEEEVLRLWEGLGYYSRARNLHRTARIVAERHGGSFPQDVDALTALPGIGRYTAGAIRSFAFDRPAPIVEANTLRLYSRLLGLTDDPRTSSAQKRLWEFAESIVPARRPGSFNLALMDLGAKVCTVSEPDCGDCPVRSQCRAAQLGLQEAIPANRKRPAVTDVVEIALAVRKGSRFLLYKRPAGQRWAGLWDFPRFEVEGSRTGGRGNAARSASRLTAEKTARLVQMLSEQFGVQADIGGPVVELTHSVTRYRIRLVCCDATFLAGRLRPGSESRWTNRSEFGRLPLSVTGRKLANRLLNAER